MVVVGEMAHSGTEGVVCRGITACRQGSIGGDFRVGDWISVASCEGTDFSKIKVGQGSHPSSQQPPLRFRQGIWRRDVLLHLH